MGAVFTTRALLGAPYDADALAWRHAVLAQGGTVSAAQLARIARLVRALKARGVWDRLDRLWIFAAENATQALTDLRTRSLATLSPTPPGFTALRGFIGNGMSAYVDLGVGASALTRYTQTAGHVAFYIQQGDGGTNLWTGADDSGSGFSSVVIGGMTTSSDFRLQTSGVGNSMMQGGQSGLHIADRQSSTAASWMRNGVDTDANRTVSSAASRATSTLTALARNTSGSYSSFSSSRLSMVSVGGTYGASGRVAVAVTINAYMASVGANTY